MIRRVTKEPKGQNNKRQVNKQTKTAGRKLKIHYPLPLNRKETQKPTRKLKQPNEGTRCVSLASHCMCYRYLF